MLPLWQSVQILVWGGLPSMAKQGQTMVLLSTAENHKQNGRNRNRKKWKNRSAPYFLWASSLECFGLDAVIEQPT
jgi:hypothetical protein